MVRDVASVAMVTRLFGWVAERVAEVRGVLSVEVLLRLALAALGGGSGRLLGGGNAVLAEASLPAENLWPKAALASSKVAMRAALLNPSVLETESQLC